MTTRRIETEPIDGQKPGTSGLRKRTSVFMRPGYLENFVQSIFNAIGGVHGKTLVLGGDGRHFCREAALTILRVAAGNRAERILVGRGGLLSTPAASHLIRKRVADGGIILSASHNPGGPEGDFGVKFNIANGGPAPEGVTAAIYGQTRIIGEYFIADDPGFDLDGEAGGTADLEGMTVEIVDPVADYRRLMQELFDFDAIRALFRTGFTMRFDGMHAITGPYAKAILEDDLGAPAGTVVNAVPLPDFGGGHPDPNPVWARDLMDLMMSDDAPDFGAASDGDGDRNMIVGRGAYVTPSDSLAVLAANATVAPAYAGGLKGVARSMPTSRAIDAVARDLGIDVYATPTGWKFFGNLLDAGRVTICGEESAGTGSDHVREKDGLWAVLLWLNILAERRRPVANILRAHWADFGRHYYSRHDYEAVDAEAAASLISDLRGRLPDLPGTSVNGMGIVAAEDFAYDDPVDKTTTTGQGIEIRLDGNARMIFRLSGTGTEGATLRVYLELFEPETDRQAQETQAALAPLAETASVLCGLTERLGRTSPDVMT